MKSFSFLFPFALISLFLSSSHCKTMQVPVHSERIDLNAIKMEGSESGDRIVEILQNKKGENYIALNLVYKDSGINIIEGIKSGEIMDHSIVVCDNEGNEIGREPINFQAFTLTTIETIRTEKDEQFVLSEDGSLFGKESLAKTSKSSQMDPNFQHKSYNLEDRVPQIIPLIALPKVGTFISIYIELTYFAHFIDELCDETSERDCPELKKKIFNKVKKRNDLELSRLQTAIQNKVFNPKEEESEAPSRKSIPVDQDNNSESDLKFKSLLSNEKYKADYKPANRAYVYNNAKSEDYCNSVEECRVAMKTAIQDINSRNQSFSYGEMAKPDENRKIHSFFDQSVTYDGNRVFFREWNLVSSPRFFRVDSIGGVKKEAPREEGIIDLNRNKPVETAPKIRMPTPKD